MSRNLYYLETYISKPLLSRSVYYLERPMSLTFKINRKFYDDLVPYADVCFQVENEIIKANKCILASQSLYFKSLIERSQELKNLDKKSDHIEITTMSKNVFQFIIYLIYQQLCPKMSEFELTDNEVFEVLDNLYSMVLTNLFNDILQYYCESTFNIAQLCQLRIYDSKLISHRIDKLLTTGQATDKDKLTHEDISYLAKNISLFSIMKFGSEAIKMMNLTNLTNDDMQEYYGELIKYFSAEELKNQCFRFNIGKAIIHKGKYVIIFDLFDCLIKPGCLDCPVNLLFPLHPGLKFYKMDSHNLTEHTIESGNFKWEDVKSKPFKKQVRISLTVTGGQKFEGEQLKNLYLIPTHVELSELNQ